MLVGRRDGTIVDHRDILLTLAEVSVAFAGFSGVVAVFGRRDPSSWSFSDRYRFILLVETSLSLLLLCILPFGLFSVHITDESVWRAMSALAVSYIVLSIIFSIRRRRAAPSSESAELTSIFAQVFMAGYVLILILSVYNTVYVAEFGPFLVALILLLARSGYLFARMLISGFGGGLNGRTHH